MEYFIEPKYHQNGAPWNFEHLFYTHKDLVSSITDDDQKIRCPVHGKWCLDLFESIFEI